MEDEVDVVRDSAISGGKESHDGWDSHNPGWD